jgi:predicted ribosome quality control (RQC) complex YloA/Tae2 family protein
MGSENRKKSKRQAFSVNIPDEKKKVWARIAKDFNRPLGWLVIEMIDKMIEAGSIHIYKDSEQSPSAAPVNIDDALKDYVKQADLDRVLNMYVTKSELESMTKKVAPAGDEQVGDLLDRIAELENTIEQLKAAAKPSQPNLHYS